MKNYQFLLTITLVSTSLYGEALQENTNLFNNDLVETSFLMQSRYTYDKIEHHPAVNDLVIRRIETGASLSPNQWISANFLYIFEDIGQGSEINLLEEAYISIANSSVTPFYLNVGKMLLPFGKFDYFTAREPYTIDYGETIRRGILVGYKENGLNLGTYAFMDKNDHGNEQLDYFGVTLDYDATWDDLELSTRVSYINDLTRAGGFMGILAEQSLQANKTPGFGLALSAAVDKLGFIAEYMTAGDDIAGENTKTAILNLEASYTFEFATAALSYIHTSEAEVADLPENVISITLPKEIFQYTTLSFEYANIESYDKLKQDSAVLQLAIAF